MKSMTGFGRAVKRDRRFDIEAEVRSVNHRFLSLKVSMPEALSHYESEVEQLVRDRLTRGSVVVSVAMTSNAEAGPALPSLPRLRQVYKGLEAMRRALGVKGDISMETLLSVPGLWSSAALQNGTTDKAWPAVRKLVEKALDGLVSMRESEGQAIRKEVLSRLELIDRVVARIRERAPMVVNAYQKKLDDRIGSLLAEKGLEVAKQDLVREIALFADRCDISEELQRLSAHVEGYRKIVRDGGAIGRRLDFLTQEMLRETNTMASKGSDSGISALAVEIKAELEKLKEQAENVE